MPKAKKKSADPVQQALRDHKSEWKDSQKEFVAHLMGLKNGLNGRGDTRFSIPPSNIKDPVPGEISALLGALTSQFQTLVGGASSIIAEQNSYSQARRKKQEKKLDQKKPGAAPQNANQPASNEGKPPAADNAVDGLLSNIASNESELEKYASKPSRMIQYLLTANPWTKEKDAKKRSSLLSATAEIYYEFLDFENAILSLDMESIVTATYQFQSIWDNSSALKSTLNEDFNDEPDGHKAPPGAVGNGDVVVPPVNVDGDTVSPSEQPDAESNKPASNKDRLRNIMGNPAHIKPQSARGINKLPPAEIVASVLDVIHKEINVIYHSKIPMQKECRALINLIREFANAQSSQNHELAHDLFNKIDSDFRTIKMAAATMVDQVADKTKKEKAKKEKLKSILKETNFTSEEIVKLSHNWVTRLLKKKWVGLRSSNKTAVHRLAIANRIEAATKILKKMMSGLEKKIDEKELNKDISSLLLISGKIQDSVRILNIMYRQHAYKEFSKRRKGQKPTDNHMNPLMDGIYQGKFKQDVRRLM